MHVSHDRINAVKGSSHTAFIASSSGEIRLLGREGYYSKKVKKGTTVAFQSSDMADIIFRCSGMLYINWVLDGFQ